MVGQSPRVVTTAWSWRAPLYWNGSWYSGMVGQSPRKITTRWSHSHCRPASPLGWRIHVVEIRTKTYWYSGIVAWFGQNARVVTTVWLWRAPRYWHARLVYWYGWFVGRVDHPEYENGIQQSDMTAWLASSIFLFVFGSGPCDTHDDTICLNTYPLPLA